jgi:hypothetical protein
MSADSIELLRLLRYELNWLQQGGYPPKVETSPGGILTAESPFLGNYSCINFRDPVRSHACRECLLWMFVPPEYQTEDIPCHYITINGETVVSLMESGDRARLVAGLEQWLKARIAELEKEQEAGADEP